MVMFTLHNTPLARQKILLRVDFNVPLLHQNIVDNSKIMASLPTIRHLLEHDCTPIILTHLGRPEGMPDPKLSTAMLAAELKKLLPEIRIFHLPACIGSDVKNRINAARPGQIIMLENLRFHPEEEKNDSTFARELAKLGDIYVNDAFGVSHRAHASVDAITQYLPSAAGLLMEKEVTNLRKALHPQKPVVWIMGGAKLDKIALLQHALDAADHVLMGGALAFAFLKARGTPIGMSKCDVESIQNVRKILQQKAARKIILPVDFIASEGFSQKAPRRVVSNNELGTSLVGLDIGPKTIELFKEYLRKAQTIVWNGPLGYYEWPEFAVGTKEIGRFLGTLTATTICGGGETGDALRKFKLDHRLTHVSTGGGAALEFLAGEKLPGIAALERNYTHFKRTVEKMNAEPVAIKKPAVVNISVVAKRPASIPQKVKRKLKK